MNTQARRLRRRGKIYLKKRRRNSSSAPSVDEITKIVEVVRAKRYAKK